MRTFGQRLSYSQTYRFENFSSDDGYTGIGFPTFVQDSLGFLWIKAANGLYRYDGYGFKVYDHDPMDSLWTHFNDWGQPTIDPSGNLWINDSRLRSFNRDLDDFITYSPRYSPGGGIVTTFFEKDKETIWLGMWSQGLVSLNLKTNKTVEYSNNENPIGTIVDRGAYFLLATQRGLWKFDKGSKKFLRPSCSKEDSLVFTKVIPRVFVSEDHYWMHVVEPLHQFLVKVDTSFVVLKILDMSEALKSLTIRIVIQRCLLNQLIVIRMEFSGSLRGALVCSVLIPLTIRLTISAMIPTTHIPYPPINWYPLWSIVIKMFGWLQLIEG